MMNRKRVNSVFLFAAGIGALIFANQLKDGILEGLIFCGNALIPSVFPFMVLAVLAVKSGMVDAIGRWCNTLSKILFGLPGTVGAVIFLGIIGGYPVAARGIAALYKDKKIDMRTAEAASYFAVAAGPGFLVNFVGIGLFGNAEVGWYIFLAQATSVIILGVVNKFLLVRRGSYISFSEINQKSIPLSQALTESIVSATYGVLEMCGAVMLFSGIISIADFLLKNFGETAIFSGILLEVTTACTKLSGNPLLTAFAVGFAGLSVHFQIYSALRDIPIKKWLFFLYRILQGALTTALTYLFLKIFRVSLSVFSSISYKPELSLSTTLTGSVLLILSGLCFIYTIGKDR